MTEASHGTWRSPIGAAEVARGEVRLGGVALGPNGDVWWTERRPEEGGRTVVVRQLRDRRREDQVPQGWNVRTRVHEYGGGAWLALDDGALVFANWDDQRLYLHPAGADVSEVVPLTSDPPIPQTDRYADLVLAPNSSEVICVREREIDGGPAVRRDLVAVALDGSLAVRTLIVDGHFLSNPRPSPDGTQLSWLTWNHPRMPWDGTELRVARFERDGSMGEPRTILGGPEESVFQPEWASTNTLYAVSDRSGWWNPYEVTLSGEVRSVCQLDEEFGSPQWVFGMARLGILGDGRLAVTHGRGTWSLSVLDPAKGSLDLLAGPRKGGDDTDGPRREITYFESALAVRGSTIATIAGGPSMPLSVVVFDLADGSMQLVRESLDDAPGPEYLPNLRSMTVVGPEGRDVHSFVYAPKNPEYVGAIGERAPYVALVHGGPTAQASPVLDLETAFFTSRGIGVVDVDYGGSTGYGREYRNRLRGEWGVIDVEDVIAVVQALAESGDADPSRLLIRGGSAGGWTVLAALTGSDVFSAGASYYGVGDLIGLVEDTHDFESRYIDGLVGPLPEARSLYVERSPLSHVDQLSCPVLLLQGADDKIVPPSQAEMFRDALRRKGIPHAYLLFEGEQHGFRRAESVVKALEAELSFYGQVLGFEPPEVPVLALENGGD